EIEAIYHIRNDGVERNLRLLFVAIALKADSMSPYSVWLDDKPIAGAYSTSSPLPAGWHPPQFTPAFEEESNGEGLRYETDERTKDSSVIAFTLTMPSGVHTIRVQYHAMPTSNSR